MLKFGFCLAAIGLCASPAFALHPPAGDSVAARAGLNGQELRLGPDGLLSGSPGLHSNRVFAFGMPKAEIVAAVTAIRGAPTETGANAECGAGPMDFVHFGGLSLNFQQDRFVGWSVGPPAGAQPLEDHWGLRLGTARANLTDGDQPAATIETSTLGVEFDADGIGGLLSSDAPDATVTVLWAGSNCQFR